MKNVQSTIGSPTDAPEAGTERANGARRPFVLCTKHLEQRREWINMPDGPDKQVEQRRLFQGVAFCPECQELSWSSQAVPPPQEQPQSQPQDTYSWWRDVMGQP